MKLENNFVTATLFLIFSSISPLWAQIADGVYIADVENQRHELKVANGYLIHSVYSEAPAKFIKTVGGFYEVQDDMLNVKLEFNSNHETDGVAELSIPIEKDAGKLLFKTTPELPFLQVDSLEQELDGAWLFATRGPDEGQDRRGEENPRKTLKFLLDGRFQWIAYHTENMKFSGTGGGTFTSQDGIYTENIEFFSRDNSRVGATLDFKYELKGDDWHHKGKNSKGEPMYEIWARR